MTLYSMDEPTRIFMIQFYGNSWWMSIIWKSLWHSMAGQMCHRTSFWWRPWGHHFQNDDSNELVVWRTCSCGRSAFTTLFTFQFSVRLEDLCEIRLAIQRHEKSGEIIFILECITKFFLNFFCKYFAAETDRWKTIFAMWSAINECGVWMAVNLHVEMQWWNDPYRLRKIRIEMRWIKLVDRVRSEHSDEWKRKTYKFTPFRLTCNVDIENEFYSIWC